MYKLAIKNLRTAKNLTQRDVSEITGISRNYISEIENYKHDVTLEILMMLSKGLGVNLEQLIELEEEELKFVRLEDRKKLKEDILKLIMKTNSNITKEFIKTLLNEIIRDLEKEN